MDYMNLVCALPVGKENAIHQEPLAKLLGVSCTALKKLIRSARNEGVHIMSGKQGYYRPKDNNERRQFISNLQKQAATRFKTANIVKAALNDTAVQIEGQLSIDDYINTSGSYI